VFAASAVLVEQKEDLALSFKLGGVQVKGLLSDFGKSLHFARHNGRYIAVLEGDSFQFERGISPVELIHPPELSEVMQVIGANNEGQPASDDAPVSAGAEAAAAAEDDDVPW
jgi:hypothetical protein